MSPTRTAKLQPIAKSQTAIRDKDGILSILHNIPIPRFRAHRILVKVACEALNPCDWKMEDRFPTPGCVDGCYFSGFVSDESKTACFQIGDRVCGGVHGSNPFDKTTDCSADYVSADAQFKFKVPPHMSMEDAEAVAGTSIVALGLAFKLCLQLPGSPTDPVSEEESGEILVYAASTSVGTLATQLLRM
ncbi:hypothetical protein J3459_017811 [Metarhizium acridum]|nr:hypothetical protein J3459_017811 [Metarhizium acridum]